MRVWIFGSRPPIPAELYRAAQSLVDGLPEGTVVVTGGAKGIDSAAEKHAIRRGLVVESWRIRRDGQGYYILRVTRSAGEYDVSERLPETFRTFGRAAYWRNRQMGESTEDAYGFWDGCSPGTRNSVAIASWAGTLRSVITAEQGQIDYTMVLP